MSTPAESRGEHDRRYREANREQIRERDRRRREANREKNRASQRRYREANREQRRERDRQYKKANREKARAAYLRSRHGNGLSTWFAETWEAQRGRCYLCEKSLDPGQAVIDHDHTCCEVQKTCAACRRGLACQPCNKLIGYGGDDPDLLERIAGNLRPVLKATRDRIAASPRQEALPW